MSKRHTLKMVLVSTVLAFLYAVFLVQFMFRYVLNNREKLEKLGTHNFIISVYKGKCTAKSRTLSGDPPSRLGTRQHWSSMG